MTFSRVRAISWIFLRREMRDPYQVIFIVIVPILIAAIFGLADKRGSESLPIGVVTLEAGPLATDLVDQISDEPALRVREFHTRDALQAAVRRGEIFAGVIIPAGYDADVGNATPTDVEILGDDSTTSFIAASAGVALVVDREDQTIAVARDLAATSGVALEVAIADARDVLSVVDTDVEKITANKASRATGLGRATAGMLVYFTFETGLMQSFLLVEDRKTGIIARMATTATRDREIVAGATLGRVVHILFQGFVLIAVGALLFGIKWGNLLAVATVVILFSLVATPIGLIVGSRRSTVDSTFARVGASAVLGLLGGCFFALALVPDWMRILGHVTPHAWAVDGLSELVSTNAGLSDVLVPVAVLAGLAAFLFAIALKRFPRTFEG